MSKVKKTKVEHERRETAAARQQRGSSSSEADATKGSTRMADGELGQQGILLLRGDMLTASNTASNTASKRVREQQQQQEGEDKNLKKLKKQEITSETTLHGE
jgi:hypothetical protein